MNAILDIWRGFISLLGRIFSAGATARGIWRVLLSGAAAACVAAGLTFVIRGIPEVEGALYDAAVAMRAAIVGRNDAAFDRVAVVVVQRGAEEQPPTPSQWADVIDAVFAAGADTVALELELTEPGGSFQAEALYAPLARGAWRYRDDLLVGVFAGATTGPEAFAAVAELETSIATHESAREEDGVIRTTPAQRTDLGRSLAIEAALRLGGEREDLRDTIYFKPVERPESIPVYAGERIVDCVAARDGGLDGFFEGRMVFISARSPLIEADNHVGRFLPRKEPEGPETACLQPRPSLAPIFVESGQLHAWRAVMMASGEWVNRAPLFVSALIAACAAGFGAFIGGSWRLHIAAVAWIAGMFGVLGAAVVVMELGMRPSIGAAFIAAPVAGAFTAAARRISEERTRRQVENTFGRFLPPQIIQELVEGGSSSLIEPGGEVRHVAVMFADLAGFTELSTQLDPKTLVSVVNDYLEVIVSAVEGRRGYVDKFIGDAVMALWGAPLPDDEAALRAALTAVDVRNAVTKKLQLDREAGRPAFGVKIGVASGPAVVGNVGTATRLAYTAVGQTVNVASRLEGLAVAYRCGAVTDATTAEAAREALLVRELDRVVVKGARDPIAIYEPLGLRAEANAETRRLVDAYSVGLARYRARRFEDALKIWSSLAEHDGPSAVMAEEARRLILDPPRSGWDAARRMTTKS